MAATAGVVLTLAGCGEAPLAERDPEGYKACSMLAEAEAQTDVGAKVGMGLMVGRQARKASTKSIRDAVTPIFDEEAVAASGQMDDFPVADSDAMKDACSGEGFEF